MRVLVTGGTGYIGGAVVEALAASGREALGLAHTAEVADGVRRRGGTPVAGDLRDLDGLARLARGADAVIHAANTQGADAGAVDLAATRAILRALDGSDRPFLYTSGAWVLGDTGGRVADERSPRAPVALVAWRGPLEEEVLAARGVRGIVVRPGVVFGEGGGIPGMLGRGDLPVIGDGTQRWSLVHVRDLAALYVQALAAPGGSVLHGMSLTATMREIALLGAAARGARVPERLTLAHAREGLGDFADALAIDQRLSSVRTQALLGWLPARLSLVEEFLGGRAAAA